MASLPFDLTTLEGTLACVTESLLPIFKETYDTHGVFVFAVTAIATRYLGKDLERPHTLIELSDGEEEASVFLPRAYLRAEREYHATGVLTVGMTWSAVIESEAEMAAWRARPMLEHPKAFESMVATLEHKTFGFYSWQGRVLKQGRRRIIGPFERVDVQRPDSGFLECVRSVS